MSPHGSTDQDAVVKTDDVDAGVLDPFHGMASDDITVTQSDSSAKACMLQEVVYFHALTKKTQNYSIRKL